MQAQAAKDLERLVVGALSDRGLLFDGAKAFAGPRRAGARGRGPACQTTGRQRGEKRPARKRARKRRLKDFSAPRA